MKTNEIYRPIYDFWHAGVFFTHFRSPANNTSNWNNALTYIMYILFSVKFVLINNKIYFSKLNKIYFFLNAKIIPKQKYFSSQHKILKRKNKKCKNKNYFSKR